jgi:alanyl-tRNA synthetase
MNLRAEAQALAAAAAADGGVVVARRDGFDQRQLQELATTTRAEPGVRAVVLGGTHAEGKVALVAAVPKGSDLVASELIKAAAKMLGGGGSSHPEVAVAGGRDVSRLDEALEAVRQSLRPDGR